MDPKAVVKTALGKAGVEEPARRVRQALHPEWLRQKVFDEELMTPLVLSLLAGGGRGIDAGAHKGAVLKYFVQGSPDAKHIAIEPMPDFAGLLREQFPTVSVNEVALSDHEGEATFNIVEGDLGSSSLEDNQAHVSSDAKIRNITVKVTRLDTLLADDPGPFRLLKIDVEGTEIAMLKGAKGLLERDRPVILFEHLATTPGAEELHGFLTGLGYRLHDMLGDGPLDLAAFEAANAGGKRQNFIALPR